MQTFREGFIVRAVSVLLAPLHLVAGSQCLATVAAHGLPISAAGISTFATDGTFDRQAPENTTNGDTVVESWPGSQKSVFSDSPTDEEFLRARPFLEPLIPIGGSSTSRENEALAKALQKFLLNPGVENTAALESFLSDNPGSVWQVALRTNLGIIYRRGGYWSKALEHWETAWKLGREAGGTLQATVVDRALSEWSVLLARLGRLETLEALLTEVADRDVRGGSTERLAGARESLYLMKTEPNRSFRCGPFAVGAVYGTFTPGGATAPKVFKSVCTSQGTSFADLIPFGEDLGVKLQAGRREPGSDIVVPSVVHWKVGHFAAIVAKTENGWVIQDPTFTDTIVMSKAAIDQEASGAFLVPVGSLPSTWRAMDASETKLVWGKGAVNPNSEPPPPCYAYTINQCAPCVGMANYNVDAARISLMMQDVPLAYSLPRGGGMQVAVNYSSREVASASTQYPNLGPKWNLNLVSFIVDDVNNATTQSYGPGGGILRYSGYSSTTQTFAPQLLSQIVLKRLNASAYERQFPDGSRQVYDIATTGSPKIIFMRESYDPQGNKTTYNYDANYRLRTITDPLNGTISVTYDSDTIAQGAAFYRIATISSLQRTATFTYNGAGQLWKIKDPVGIVSEFQYEAGDFINKLITPYGTTTFVKTGDGADRVLEISDQNGGRERVEFRYDDGAAVPDINAKLLPGPGINVTSQYWNYRNSYYWDKKALAESAMVNDKPDTKNAHLMHWLHKNATDSENIDILESEKWPLENRVFYNYPNQTGGLPSAYVGSSNKPTKIARVLVDANNVQSTQLYEFEYNALGNVTKAVTPGDAVTPKRVSTYQYAANGVDLVAAYQQNVQGTFTDPTDPLAQPADRLFFAGTNGAGVEIPAYNSKHLPDFIYDAAQQKTTFTYNSYGQVKTVTNAKNETTTFTYDRDQDGNGESDGYLQSVTGPVAGATQTFQYDGFNRLWKTTDSDNYTLTFTYDAVGSPWATLNRPAGVLYPDGTTEQVYYRYLDVEWSKDRQNRWTHTFHDPLRRVTAVSDPLGRLTKYDWCSCGSLESIIDGEDNQTTWFRDVRGRVTDKVYADNSFVHYEYDSSSGRLKSITDPKQQVKTFAYNIDDSLKSITYTNTAVLTPTVSYTYDSPYGRLATMTDGTGITTFTYHPVLATGQFGAGQLDSVDGPQANDTISYLYDKLGRLETRRINGTANQTVIAYDTLGRISSLTNLLGVFTPTYIGTTGRTDYVDFPLATGGANNSRIDFDYFPNVDPTGFGNGDKRLKQIRNGIGTSPVSKFDYEYNRSGQITSWSNNSRSWAPLSQPDLAEKFKFTYDAAQQLETAVRTDLATQAVKERLGYGYDDAGTRTLEQVDQVPRRAVSNNLNQVRTTAAGDEFLVSGTLNTRGTLTVEKLTGPNGTVEKAVVAPVDPQTLEFAAKVPVTGGDNSLRLRAKNATGNEVVKSITVNVPSGTQRELLYDANGNTKEVKEGGVTIRTYEWNGEDKLTAINYTATGKRTEFTYDGYGRWTKIVEKNADTSIAEEKRFLWNGFEIAEERDGTDTLQRRYFDQGYQEVLKAPGDPKNRYYLKDHLGSVREVIEWSSFPNPEQIYARYRYSPYGTRTVDVESTWKEWYGPANPSTPPDDQGTYGVPFGFTGHYHHEASGLVLAPYRAYDPSLGRWLSRDPIGEDDGINIYAYVHNQPTLLTDPLGLAAGDWWDPRSYVSVGSEMNPFNLNGSFAQTSLSIGDAMGGFLNGVAGNGWDGFINAGNGANGYKGLLEQTECDKAANYTAKGLLGVSGAATATAGFMIGGEILATRGMFSLSNHVAEQVGTNGSRYWSETMARNLFSNGTRALNSGGRRGLTDILTTIRYTQPGGGQIVRNWITNNIVHYLPY